MRAAVLGAMLAVVASAQTFRVAGVVVDAQRGTPLNRAHVILAGEHTVELVITTAGDGKFSFDVPAEKYSLFAEHNGWRTAFGSAAASSSFGSAVITGPDQDTAHLTLRWYPPGAIFGRVVDDQGEPVRDATVRLIGDSAVDGRRRISVAESARTDDRGVYRVGPLAAGNYYAVATGQPWYVVRPGVARLATGNEASRLAAAYQPTYYPGTAQPDAAAPIVLKPGAEAQVDLALRTSVGGNVRVHCFGAGTENSSCQGRTTLYVRGIGGVEILQPAVFNPATQSLSGVPPGRYTLRFSGDRMSAHRIIDVGAGDLDVNLVMQPSPVITGKVAFKDSTTTPRPSVYVQIVNEATGGRYGVAVAFDGSFSFENIGVARFRPRLYGTGGFFIAEMSADGAPLRNGVVDLAENAVVHLNILASDETGRVKGLVMNGDTPAPAVLAVLAPRAGSGDPYDYVGFQTESDGSFEFLNVPAGDYVLFAVDRTDLEYTNPDALRPYLASAKPLHIAPHSVCEERITLFATGRN